MDRNDLTDMAVVRRSLEAGIIYERLPLPLAGPTPGQSPHEDLSPRGRALDTIGAEGFGRPELDARKSDRR